MCKLNILDKLSFLLCIIGCICWASIGIFNVNPILIISFGSAIIQRLFYILFMFSALQLIYLMYRCKFLYIKQ